jgi:hypothetical protein
VALGGDVENDWFGSSSRALSGGFLALAALGVTAFVQLAGLLIWGASLTQRVRQLEAEIEPLKILPERFARIEARLDGMYEQLKDLNSSIRWMRDASEHGSSRIRD